MNAQPGGPVDPRLPDPQLWDPNPDQKQRSGPGRPSLPDPRHGQNGSADTVLDLRTPATGAQGAAALGGRQRGVSAWLPTVGWGARRRRSRIAGLALPAVAAVSAASSAREMLDHAVLHLRSVPVRVGPWAMTTNLLIGAALAAGDYFAVNAVLRSANLPPITSRTLPLVISISLLIVGKVVVAWHLGSVEPDQAMTPDDEVDPTPDGDPEVPSEVVPLRPADSVVTALPATTIGPPSLLRARERHLQALDRPVARAKRRAGVVVGLGALLPALLGLAIGFGALGSGLLGIGLNDGEHDGLLTGAAFAMTAGVFLLNVVAAVGLAYHQWIPGASAYRAAVRNVQAKAVHAVLAGMLARPARKAAGLAERQLAVLDRARVREALGLLHGHISVLTLEPQDRSESAAAAVATVVEANRSATQVIDAMYAHLNEHIRTVGGIAPPAPRDTPEDRP